MSPLHALALPLAATAPDPADVTPGWLGFALFMFLAVATVLLWLSFRKQLKKVNFEEKPEERPRGKGGGPAPSSQP
jgi:hypothetical protein